MFVNIRRASIQNRVAGHGLWRPSAASSSCEAALVVSSSIETFPSILSASSTTFNHSRDSTVQTREWTTSIRPVQSAGFDAVAKTQARVKSKAHVAVGIEERVEVEVFQHVSAVQIRELEWHAERLIRAIQGAKGHVVGL